MVAIEGSLRIMMELTLSKTFELAEALLELLS